MKKKGQVTIFIILAVILVSGISLVFYLSNDAESEENFERDSESDKNLPEDISPIEDALEDNLSELNETIIPSNVSQNNSLNAFSCTLPSCTSGKHEGLWIGEGEEKTEVIYYIPKNFNSETAQYFFLIHGAGFCHRGGALTHIDHWDDIADKENLVLIAPNFDRIYYDENENPDFSPTACNFYKSYCDKEASLNCEDYPYKKPRSFLWDFVYMLPTKDTSRHDEKIFEILDFFNENLMRREKFSIYGHSGGGQFVSRFMMIYPEKLINVGTSAAGTMLFPDFDIDFPFGLKMDNINNPSGIFRGNQNADDLIELSREDLEEKMSILMSLRVLVIAGDQDSVGNCNENPTAEWQGCYDYEKMENYYNEMRQEEIKLKQNGMRFQGETFNMKFVLLPGIGHDWKTDGDYAQMFFYSSSCYDSDGGKNYFVKGTTFNADKIESDYCSASSPNVLREFYCKGNEIKWESKTCNNGCSDGVCL